MEKVRLVQQRTVHQLFRTRPLRANLRQFQQTSQQSFRTRPFHTTFSKTTKANAPSTLFTRLRQSARAFRRNQSTDAAPAPKLSLKERLKKLSRDYGWSAVGVYLALSVLDFPFCFAAVRLLGVDRIGHWEHVILEYVKGAIKYPFPEPVQEGVHEMKEQVKEQAKELLNQTTKVEPVTDKRLLELGEKRILETGQEYSTEEVEDHGYKEAYQASTGENASLWTQLVLAYAIHKSFIFVRIPLTAAVTPKVVKTLRGWGWNIGKMPKRKGVTDGKTGVNTKGTGVKPDN